MYKTFWPTELPKINSHKEDKKAKNFSAADTGEKAPLRYCWRVSLSCVPEELHVISSTRATVLRTAWLSPVPPLGSWCKWPWRGPQTLPRSWTSLLPPPASWPSGPGRSWHWCGGPRARHKVCIKAFSREVQKWNNRKIMNHCESNSILCFYSGTTDRLPRVC